MLLERLAALLGIAVAMIAQWGPLVREPAQTSNRAKLTLCR
ncbi:hypothetical protein CUROG_09535 [Corynebacterium urogenitale]|uniref:Uncharacterized protein n=1 Tax=Corynebacterium urogenitale TaxID=2487892 RepID=A0A5J6ZAF1_9CORY|nr:hypothetical protein CUROG_09535 [Corynebacterium urogenitale]